MKGRLGRLGFTKDVLAPLRKSELRRLRRITGRDFLTPSAVVSLVAAAVLDGAFAAGLVPPPYATLMFAAVAAGVVSVMGPFLLRIIRALRFSDERALGVATVRLVRALKLDDDADRLEAARHRRWALQSWSAEARRQHLSAVAADEVARNVDASIVRLEEQGRADAAAERLRELTVEYLMGRLKETGPTARASRSTMQVLEVATKIAGAVAAVAGVVAAITKLAGQL